VPEFLPFRGLRYDVDAIGARLDAVVAPPYDVIDEDQRAALERLHPMNAVRLILPRDSGAMDRYEAATARLAAWVGDGVLARDPRPRLYGYRMEFIEPDGTFRTTVGVLGALTLPAAGDDTVLPHERTLPKAKSDRLALLRATRANLDPIWVLSLAPGITEHALAGPVIGSCREPDGTLHELHAIDDPDHQAAISAAVAREPVVLADGHHRFETAAAYQVERAAAGVEDPGAAAILALCVELSEDQLAIEPIHRAVRVPPDVDVRAQLATQFVIEPTGPAGPEDVLALQRRLDGEHALGLVDAAGCALLRPGAGALAAARAAYAPPACETDAAVVDAAITPLLPGAEWAYRHDARETAALVDKDVADAALLLRGATVDQTRRAALAGVRMPQKTTFFHPKPRTGLVFRLLDG
jgi:uncharacterized protein (DUF1015 family)